MVHDPVHGETFTAVRGEGARLNGEPIRVSGSDRMEHALVATGFSYEEQARASSRPRSSGRLLPRVRDIRRAGAAALDLAWLAAGRHDAFFERGIKHWDWAAARLVATEAGATVAELAGDPPGLIAAASSRRGLASSELEAARRGLRAALEQVLGERLELLVGELALEGRHRARPGTPRP